MRIINPIGGIILLFVLLGTLGCSEDSFQDEAKPVICPSVITIVASFFNPTKYFII